MSNLPPGVHVGQIPGFNATDVRVPLDCDMPCLYADAAGVEAAIDAAVRAVGDALGLEASRAVRRQVAAAARAALHAHWVRGDEIDTTATCTWDGDVDATRDGGTVYINCPTCGFEHTITD